MDRMMRVHAFIVLVSAVALLAACSGGPRQVGASAPSVTYSYRNDAELREANDKAASWCEDRYSAAARPTDRWPANGEATFVCVPD
jgi:outer membrane biogenesis lipoprotein LolB